MRKLFRGVKIAVIGMGASGMSMARFLHGQGASLVCYDQREPRSWEPEFFNWLKLHGGSAVSGRALASHSEGLHFAVISPGVPIQSEVVKDLAERGIPMVGDLALSASLWKGPLVAVTGTNGKTTTTLLTAHLLNRGGIRAEVAGNISPPLSQLAVEYEDENLVAVVETSSFQLEYFPAKAAWFLDEYGIFPPEFDLAIWLNIAPDHLDRHSDLTDYARAKAHLLDFLSADGLAILDSSVLPYIHDKRVKNRLIWSFGPEGNHSKANIAGPSSMLDFGFASLAEEKGQGAGRRSLEVTVQLRHGEWAEESYDISQWSALGVHNLQNLAFAIAAARRMGASRDGIQEGVSSFKPPAHRLEMVAEANGIGFIDDSKATNAAAVKSAVNSLKRAVILIAGGSYKGEDFSVLDQVVYSPEKGWGIRGAVLIGQEADRLRNVLEEKGVRCHTIPLSMRSDLFSVTGQDGMDDPGPGFHVMNRAVKEAVAMARPGELVLLSPACASFDLFSGYKQRAQAFRIAVDQIVSVETETSEANHGSESCWTHENGDAVNS